MIKKLSISYLASSLFSASYGALKRQHTRLNTEYSDWGQNALNIGHSTREWWPRSDGGGRKFWAAAFSIASTLRLLARSTRPTCKSPSDLRLTVKGSNKDRFSIWCSLIRMQLGRHMLCLLKTIACSQCCLFPNICRFSSLTCLSLGFPYGPTRMTENTFLVGPGNIFNGLSNT